MYNQEMQERVNELLKQKVNIKDISKETGISVNTIKRWEKIRETRLLVKDLINNKKYKEAIEIINFNIDRQNIFRPVFISSKIKILLKQRKYEEAELLARQSLVGEPNNKYFKGQLISALRFQGRLKEAEQLARESLEVVPNNILTKVQLINILEGQGKLDEVEKLIKEALILEPNNKLLTDKLEGILIYKTMLSPAISNNAKMNNPLFEEIRKQEYDSDNIHVSLIKLMELKDYCLDNPNDKVAMFVLAEAYYKMQIRVLTIKTCKKAVKTPDISIQDLKTFKNMIEIARSNKPVFYNTKQKVNALAKRIGL